MTKLKPENNNIQDVIRDKVNPHIFQMRSQGLDKWFYWDESYDYNGPFSSRQECLNELIMYYYWLNTGKK